ncbi:AraC family ligand binding domain-containing protein [Labrys sp. 22185]|uniref:AraC family transcriptional regulator n=1 Tax=Labrys sp. 22185 TaxID=3453888 RepID=UPI003F83F5F0
MGRRGQFVAWRGRLPGMDAVMAESSHHFPRHMHDQYGIGLIDRGSQKSASGRGPVEAGAGDVITVNPGEVHDGSPIGDHGRAWRMLYFDPALMREAIGDIREGGSATFEIAEPVVRDSRVAGLFASLFQSLTGDATDVDGLRREEALLMLLAHIPGAAAERSAILPAIGLAREHIDSDPIAPVSLSDLAGMTGLSRFQVVRGFARATGMTAYAYVMQRRLQLSRRHIAGGMALAEAAAAGGFADQSHMTRLFVRSYGISPGAYAAARVS